MQMLYVVSFVHPVAVLNAEFILLMLVEDAR